MWLSDEEILSVPLLSLHFIFKKTWSVEHMSLSFTLIFFSKMK